MFAVKDTKSQLQDALENGVAANQAGPSSGGAAAHLSHDGDESDEAMDISDPDTDDERKVCTLQGKTKTQV